MKTNELEYDLPKARIAQRSVKPRDHSRLLVFDRASGEVHHYVFRNIVAEFKRGDLLVFNDTKVFRARLNGGVNGKPVEIFLVRPRADGWLCLGKPAKRLSAGMQVDFTRSVRGIIIERFEHGEFVTKFFSRGRAMSANAVIAFANKHGEIPLPSYVASGLVRFSEYQTIFARRTGSVAAPTAAFHFTKRLMRKLKERGVKIAKITLHVGLGTFQPIKTDLVEDHSMHGEWAEISATNAKKIFSAKRDGRRVIAVGTTTTRALEGWCEAVAYDTANLHTTECAWSGDISLFITPGFCFQIIDGLITNFHFPKSTLMLLVAAFIEMSPRFRGRGITQLKKLYAEAISADYRFYSFGDAMFII